MDNTVKLGCLARPQERSELMLPSRISFGIPFVSGVFQKDQRHSDLSIYVDSHEICENRTHPSKLKDSESVKGCGLLRNVILPYNHGQQSWAKFAFVELSLNRTCPTLPPSHRSSQLFKA